MFAESPDSQDRPLPDDVGELMKELQQHPDYLRNVTPAQAMLVGVYWMQLRESLITTSEPFVASIVAPLADLACSLISRHHRYFERQLDDPDNRGRVRIFVGEFIATHEEFSDDDETTC